MGAGVDHLPVAGRGRLNPTGDPAATHPDDQAADRPDHQQQAEGIADETGDTDQYPADQDHQSVEQLGGGHFSPSQSLLSVSQHPNADAPDDKESERAHEEQERQRREETDLLGYENE